MPLNPYVSRGTRNEQSLLEDLTIESLKMYGQDCFYLPRTLVNESRIFREDIGSSFDTAYKVEMYIENTDGFDGDGDLFTKFGVEIRDNATFIMAKRTWKKLVAIPEVEFQDNDRPREGDIIFLPLSQSMFEVMHVEHEQPFYQLNNLYTYKMRAELFEMADEDFDTSITDIDEVQADFGYTFKVTVPRIKRAVARSTVTQ